MPPAPPPTPLPSKTLLSTELITKTVLFYIVDLTIICLEKSEKDRHKSNVENVR